MPSSTFDQIRDFAKTSGMAKALDEAIANRDLNKVLALSLTNFLIVPDIQKTLGSNLAAHLALKTFLSFAVPAIFEAKTAGGSLAEWAMDIAQSDLAALHRAIK